MPGLGEQSQAQRRLQEKRRVRQSLLLDLGAIVYELHRQGKRAPDLLQRRAAQLTVVDDEVRELEARLGGEQVRGEPEPEAPMEDEHQFHVYEEEEPDPVTEEVDPVEAEMANHGESRG